MKTGYIPAASKWAYNRFLAGKLLQGLAWILLAARGPGIATARGLPAVARRRHKTMRKELGKALRALFSRAMKERFPLYNEVKVASIYFWPGQRAFCRAVSPSLHLWIVLSPSPKDYDEFTVLIGWSRLGRYPELSMIPSFRLPEEGHGEFEETEYLTRLPFLWAREDRWWVIREFLLKLSTEALMKEMEPISPGEAQRLTAPLVEDAVMKLEIYALPYFDTLLGRGDINRQ